MMRVGQKVAVLIAGSVAFIGGMVVNRQPEEVMSARIALEFELTPKEEEALDPSVRGLWVAMRDGEVDKMSTAQIKEVCSHAFKQSPSSKIYWFALGHEGKPKEGDRVIVVRTDGRGRIAQAMTVVPCW